VLLAEHLVAVVEHDGDLDVGLALASSDESDRSGAPRP
jgi:hypothetical protein